MEIVAQHLHQEAIHRTSPIERDLFGRSAFNRYYYSMFIEVRASLAMLRPEWSRLAHAAIPDLLKGKVKDELKRGRKRAEKMGDFDVVSLCESALSATEALAKLMEQGYATRVTADYYPDIPVDFLSANDFQLNTVSVKKAQAWPHRASAFLKTITSAWKQLNA